MTEIVKCDIIAITLSKTVGRLSSTREYKLWLHIENLFGNLYERRTLAMITISLQTVYYALGIASILCGSAYKIGYEIGKNARK